MLAFVAVSKTFYRAFLNFFEGITKTFLPMDSPCCWSSCLYFSWWSNVIPNYLLFQWTHSTSHFPSCTFRFHVDLSLEIRHFFVNVPTENLQAGIWILTDVKCMGFWHFGENWIFSIRNLKTVSTVNRRFFLPSLLAFFWDFKGETNESVPLLQEKSKQDFLLPSDWVPHVHVFSFTVASSNLWTCFPRSTLECQCVHADTLSKFVNV